MAKEREEGWPPPFFRAGPPRWTDALDRHAGTSRWTDAPDRRPGPTRWADVYRIDALDFSETF